MLKKIAQKIWQEFKNIPGVTLNQKVIVLEVDDFGSHYLSSLQHKEGLIKMGAISSKSASNFDGLETADDLKSLFDVLNSHLDAEGKPFRLTPFVNIANIDVDKLLAGEISPIYFDDYLMKIGETSLLEQYRKGIASGIFVPQSHGREHVATHCLLEAFQSGNEKVKSALLENFYHPKLKSDLAKYKSFRPGFYFDNHKQKEYLNEVIKSALTHFNRIFGYQATVFCPQNGVFHTDFKPILNQLGVHSIVESGVRYAPDGSGGVNSYRNYVMGKRDSLGLFSYSRNVTFEPNKFGAKNAIITAMRQIDSAFRWNKPAVLASHRSNFTSRVSLENRDKGLDGLDLMIKAVKKKYPDVIFMSSGELSNYWGKRQ
ncbi:MAG: hypothetical protein LAT68_11370 [Cyclobacteriaceae bacterium]|nr:hypothetical protein [Cyclobacteriaceae bacterium]MCH8516916.1 hypothetical protein [Cyclobacteriaceae bacterium]